MSFIFGRVDVLPIFGKMNTFRPNCLRCFYSKTSKIGAKTDSLDRTIPPFLF